MVKYRYFVTFLYLNVFFLNLRFLQLSVSILGELGTLKKSIARGTGSNFHVPRNEGWTISETFL